MKTPTDKQQAIWKTYMALTATFDAQFGDEFHDLHQTDAIRQISLIAGKPADDIRKDIIIVCEWLKTMFVK